MTDPALTLVTDATVAPRVKKSKKKKSRPAVNLPRLMESWELALRAERKSPSTISSYLTGVRQYLLYCSSHDAPAVIDRHQLAAFVDHLLTGGAQPATAVARQIAVRRFSSWLAAERELDVDPLLGVKPPKMDQKVVEPLTEAQIKALVKACSGTTLRDRRDEAIVRLMVETGARAGEVVAIMLDDMHHREGTAIIRRGKGGKGRSVAFGDQTTLAIDRYLRVRREHSLAERSPALWLGGRGQAFHYEGLHKSLSNRALAAGIPGFHPHRLRHTAAHRWLAAGGSEGGLMAMAGWTRPDMLLRYTKRHASDRAAEEAKTLDLGSF